MKSTIKNKDELKKNDEKKTNKKNTHEKLQIGERPVLFIRTKKCKICESWTNTKFMLKNFFEHLNKLPGFEHLTSGLASAREP